MQTNDIEANPFAILSFIIAPAILTNASSVLAMSTSNRLARAVDRARELTKQLEEYVEAGSAVTNRRLRELAASETRALMLIRALRSFYAALGAFASAALLSLLGAVVVSARADLMVPILEAIGVVAGVFAVGALVHGLVLLVHETRIAVKVLSDRAAEVRSRLTT